MKDSVSNRWARKTCKSSSKLCKLIAIEDHKTSYSHKAFFFGRQTFLFLHQVLQAWLGQASICPPDLGQICSTDSIIRQFVFRRFSHLEQLLKKIEAVDVVVRNLAFTWANRIRPASVNPSNLRLITNSSRKSSSKSITRQVFLWVICFILFLFCLSYQRDLIKKNLPLELWGLPTPCVTHSSSVAWACTHNNDARTQTEYNKILMHFYSTTIFYFCCNCGVSGISSPLEGVNAKRVKQKPKKKYKNEF